MTRPTQALIDGSALSHNLSVVKRFAPKARVLAMVKADAYGHGLLVTAKALQAADALGVACLEEALALREQGITQPIVLMEGPLSAAEITAASQHALQLVLHHRAQLAYFETNPPPQPLMVWIKLDTGMHRLGFAPDEAGALYHWCQQHRNWVRDVGWMTHFAQAESTHPAFTEMQITRFGKALQGLPGPRTLANSAGIIAWPQTHADWVRPGIMLYGISPIAGKTGADYGLKPAMHLQSAVIAVNQLQPGESVGYGCCWQAPEAMPYAVVAAGYGDGYPHTIASGAPVKVAGRIVPLIGRISMDMLAVDCRHYREVAIGDAVTLWGPELPVERVADAAGTSAYALVTQITSRVKR